MRHAGGEFLEACVDIKGTDFQLEGLVFVTDIPFSRCPFAEGDEVGFGDGGGGGAE